MGKMFDTFDVLFVIFEQEGTVYKCDDYISGFHKHRHTIKRVCFSRDSPSTQSLVSSESSKVDESWRELICEWIFNIIDYYSFNRETAAVAMSYLDRFLASRPSVSRETFQLAAMTALYLAIKLLEPCHLQANDLAKLSHGRYSAEHIVIMEESILR